MTRKRKWTTGPNTTDLLRSDFRMSHFFKIMLPSAIEDKMLRIPNKFVRKYGDELSNVATLIVPDGRDCQVGLTKAENDIWFHDGWHEFVEYHSIRHGYFLVFRYGGNSNFHVLIFDMSACEIDYPCNGPSSDEEPNYRKKHSVWHEDEMEDDDSVEVLGAETTPYCFLENRILDESACKPATRRRYNSSFKQNLARSFSGSGLGVDKPCGTAGLVQIPKPRRIYLTRSNQKENQVGKDDFCERIGSNKLNNSHGSLRTNRNMKENAGTSRLQTQSVQEKCLNSIGTELRMARQGANRDVKHPTNVVHNAEAKECLRRDKNVSFLGRGLRKTADEHELSVLHEEDDKIFFSEKSFRTFSVAAQKKAINAARMLKLENPSFIVITKSTNYHKSYAYVPAVFAKRYLSRVSEYLKLQDWAGRNWCIRIVWSPYGGLKLSRGWAAFSRANNLVTGDVCVFELIKMNDVLLKVTVSHCSLAGEV